MKAEKYKIYRDPQYPTLWLVREPSGMVWVTASHAAAIRLTDRRSAARARWRR